MKTKAEDKADKAVEKKPSGGGGKMVKGFLVGAAVGSGVALLYAKRPGKETRKILANKAKSLKSQGESVIEQGRKMLNTGMKGLKSSTNGKPVARRAAAKKR